LQSHRLLLISPNRRNPDFTPTMKKPKRVFIAIDPAVHAKLKKLAKRNGRTLKGQIELLINAEVLY
jgi:macrodomain Ter protein organizer (MatP/YcbG family)